MAAHRGYTKKKDIQQRQLKRIKKISAEIHAMHKLEARMTSAFFPPFCLYKSYKSMNCNAYTLHTFVSFCVCVPKLIRFNLSSENFN